MSLTKFFRTIARALRRAAQAFVRKLVWVGGKLVSMLVPSPIPVPDDGDDFEMDTLDERAHGADHFGYVRAVAAVLLAGKIPHPEFVDKLNENEVEWLLACDDEMLRAVVRADDRALSDHLSGRKAIRGVLRSDPAAVSEYVQRMKRDRRVDDHEEDEIESLWAPA